MPFHWHHFVFSVTFCFWKYFSSTHNEHETIQNVISLLSLFNRQYAIEMPINVKSLGVLICGICATFVPTLCALLGYRYGTSRVLRYSVFVFHDWRRKPKRFWKLPILNTYILAGWKYVLKPGLRSRPNFSDSDSDSGLEKSTPTQTPTHISFFFHVSKSNVLKHCYLLCNAFDANIVRKPRKQSSVKACQDLVL